MLRPDNKRLAFAICRLFGRSVYVFVVCVDAFVYGLRLAKLFLWVFTWFWAAGFGVLRAVILASFP
jgi:hypothetical protein